MNLQSKIADAMWHIDLLIDGIRTLKTVKRIAEQLKKRNRITRIIFYMADGRKIRQTRDNIRSAVEKFQVWVAKLFRSGFLHEHILQVLSIKMNDLLLEVKATQQNLSKQIDDRNGTDNARKEKEGMEDEDKEDEDEDEDDVEDDVEDEDEDEPATLVTKRRTRPSRVTTAPTLPTSGFSFSNSGSGQMYNQNFGNIVTTTYSKKNVYG